MDFLSLGELAGLAGDVERYMQQLTSAYIGSVPGYDENWNYVRYKSMQSVAHLARRLTFLTAPDHANLISLIRNNHRTLRSFVASRSRPGIRAPCVDCARLLPAPAVSLALLPVRRADFNVCDLCAW
mgnify:CR=1 FL=1